MTPHPYFKLALYVLIAIVIGWIDGLKDYTNEQIHSWSWIEWSTFIGAMILQGLLVMRTFFDQSVSKWPADQAKNADHAAVVAETKRIVAEESLKPMETKP